MRLHTGDKVLVISGKDRGKTGTIIKVLPETLRVVVSSVNMRTKHIRKTPQQAGRKIRYEASVHISNVMLLDSKTGKPTRVGYRLDEKGRKLRIAKVSGEAVERGKVSKKERATEEVREAAQEKVESTRRQPFWKKMGFGGAEAEEAAEVSETPRGKEDHSIPGEQMHVRTGQRGS